MRTGSLGTFGSVMDREILQKLETFGLSENEAKTYCAALVLEVASVDSIARHAKLHRSSCYPILEKLKRLGLVSQSRQKGKLVFKASPPEKFLDILEEKRQEIQKIMPALKSLFEITEGKPGVRLYEGKEGLKTVLNSILKEAKEVLIFGDGDSFKKVIPHWTDGYAEKRKMHNIKAKIILKATPSAIKKAKILRSLKSTQSSFTKIRVLPEAYVAPNGGFDIFNDTVVLYSFEKQKVATVIESKVISRMMEGVFEILWNEAGKYDRTLLRER